ncbi:precorrin-2 C(20)-methyltransferase [soil metagenome]
MTKQVRLAVVGVGPGDPELITLKGLRRIQAAQTIFVPRSRDSQQSIAHQIANEYLDLARQRIVELPLVMATDPAYMLEAWEAAATLMAQTLPATGEAVYLVLGDPSLYGTFTYLATALQTQRPDLLIEIIPGVNSYSAAAAAAGLPLAIGNERVAILPAVYEEDVAAVVALLDQFDTLILLKAGSALPRLKAALLATHRTDQILVAERVGFANQRLWHGLEALPDTALTYFSLAIVKKNC